jgi:predicted secreted hydrolase
VIRRRIRELGGLAALAILVGACSGGPILANAPAPHPTTPPESPPASRLPDPVPVVLPRDDAAHDRLNEWWYYTGHLRDEAGNQWGFEFVVFRAERGAFPVTWASHLAFTNETDGTFHDAQRSEVGPQVDHANATSGGANGAAGFDLAINGGAAIAAAPGGGFAPPAPSPTAASAPPSAAASRPWSMAGSGGNDHLEAAFSPEEAVAAGLATAQAADGAASNGAAATALGLALDLRADKPVALHNTIGWIDFGPAGSSYYYSRTRMTAAGSITVGGRRLAADGIAWFDHQWGDFIAVGAGGWDWFALQLGDGQDITLSLVRGPTGGNALVYGTSVDTAGRSTHLEATDFSVNVTHRWQSPLTNVDYPAGWTVRIPGQGLVIGLVPTVPGQELDTRATSGVVYWEGSQRVTATRFGKPVGGEAYVELTGYSARP